MKLIDGTLADLLALAEEEDRLEPNDTLRKQWIKSITNLDKSTSTGYSLVGDFISESDDLEPGLYLIYQEFTRRFIVEKSFAKWEGVGGNRRLSEDENGHVIFEARKTEEITLARRGILFDFSGQAARLVYCRFLPERWAKKLWNPIEDWLEHQPNIEEKIAYWKQEVDFLQSNLERARRQLALLENHHSGANEELAPELYQWLQTAAVLGGKKKQSKSDRFEGV